MSERVSVIVPTYQRPEDLRRCLRGLTRQERPADEILVVARPQDHATTAVCQELNGTAPVRVVYVDRPGQVAALNAGRAAARGSIVAMTDDDAEPRPDWLRRIESHFGDPGVGAVGGRDIVHEAGRPVPLPEVSRVGVVQWFGRPVGRHHHPSRRQEVQFLKGANMAYRAEALRPFAEDLLGRGAQVCNDLEASLSVSARGWRIVFDPAAAVDHHPAPRHDDDARGRPSRPAMQAAAHNELYALLRHVPAWQRLPVAAYAIAIGQAPAPGIVRGAVSALRSPRAAGTTLSVVGALAQARVRGVRTAARARRAPSPVEGSNGRPA